MKLLPLVWTALWRKPGETLLVCLAVTAAFTLFGLMSGLHATYRAMVDSARQDRLEVGQRFPIVTHGLRMPIAMREQIAHIPGVSAVGAYDVINGYYRDPHNHGQIMAVDKDMRTALSELPLSAAQWDALLATPTGVLVSEKRARQWHLGQGDTLPFVSQSIPRADGSSTWEFHVLAIVPDDPMRANGFILGNDEYVNHSRLPQDQGYVAQFRVAVADPAQANAISLKIDRGFANSGTPTISIPDKSNWENASRWGISAASIAWPVAAAGLFMILLVTANAIAQSVRERIPEFAVLSTVGFRHSTLGALVVMEAAFPCLLGAAVGTALAGALTLWPASYLPADLRNVPKPTVSFLVLAWALGSAAVLALVSAALPVLRLKRLSVAKALAGP